MSPPTSPRMRIAATFLLGAVVGCALTLAGLYLPAALRTRDYDASQGNPGMSSAIASSSAETRGDGPEHRQGDPSAAADISLAAAGIARQTAALAQAGGDLQGADAAGHEVIVRLMRTLEEHTHHFAAALTQFEALGGIDPAGIGSREDIAARLAALDEMQRANEAFIGFLRPLEEQLKVDLMLAGVAPTTARARAKNGAAQSHIDLAIQIRHTDRRIIAAARSLLTLLDQRWDAWRFDPTAKTLRFASEDDTRQYNQTFASLQAAGAEQAALQERIADTRTAPAGR